MHKLYFITIIIASILINGYNLHSQAEMDKFSHDLDASLDQRTGNVLITCLNPVASGDPNGQYVSLIEGTIGCEDRPMDLDTGKTIYIGYNLIHSTKKDMLKYKTVGEWLNSQVDPQNKKFTTYKHYKDTETVQHFLDRLPSPTPFVDIDSVPRRYTI